MKFFNPNIMFYVIVDQLNDDREFAEAIAKVEEEAVEGLFSGHLDRFTAMIDLRDVGL